MSEADTGAAFVPAGFFALRTPLLPLAEWLSWGEGLAAPTADDASLSSALAADQTRLRARLLELIARPEVREALFVASPTLDDSIDAWRRDPERQRGRSVERTLVRYFARMAGRATPFGLFAGHSLGVVGAAEGDPDTTRLVVGARAGYRRHTRFDMDYLCALASALAGDAALRPALTFRPNSSLYRAAGRVRCLAAHLAGTARGYRLIALDPTEALVATLERSRDGASPATLAAALVDEANGVTAEEAVEFVDALIDGQILVPDLAPAVTGPEPIHRLIEQLRGAPPLAALLDEARAALAELDAGGLGASPRRYRATASSLARLPVEPELPRLFQVDLVKPAVEARLGSAVVAELARGLELLRQVVPPVRHDPLARFRAAFVRRYEAREVPLCEALDDESGVGFDADTSGADVSPLLAGLAFPVDEELVAWSPRWAWLLRRVDEARATGQIELHLGPADLAALRQPEPPPLPDALAVLATVAAPSRAALDEGRFRVHLTAASGPSGAALLGRFCHADPRLEDAVRGHLAREEALRPDAIFAEVVHLPAGRVGNVLARPVLRAYELPFLGRSGAPPGRQIALDDLRVSVVDARVVLRSTRLGREVLPRLTSAHDYRHPDNLGLYRFLGALQSQGTATGLTWSWGPLAASAFLPRVVCGRLVLQRARWSLDPTTLAALAAEGADPVGCYRAIQALRRRLRLPRHVLLVDDDQRLPVDLDNVLSVETLAQLLRRRREAVLVELEPGPGDLCAEGPEGSFVHEVVVPFVRAAPRAPASALPRPAPSRLTRSFLPGSEWLYARIHAGAVGVDRVLCDAVAPLIQQVLASGAADGWFFLRHGDPDWHLRLRLHGPAERLTAEVLPALHRAVAPLVGVGLVTRLELGTYEREVERYGGDRGILLAERVFQADSEAVLAIVERLEGDAGAEWRWRLALRGVDLLLDDLGCSLDDKLAVVGPARAGLARELRAGGELERHLAGRYRQQRRELEALLAPDAAAGELAPLLSWLERRSLRLAPLREALREAAAAGELTASLADLAASHVHMHCNRLLRGSARAHELILYDFLGRLYASRRAHARRI